MFAGLASGPRSLQRFLQLMHDANLTAPELCQQLQIIRHHLLPGGRCAALLCLQLTLQGLDLAVQSLLAQKGIIGRAARWGRSPWKESYLQDA